MVDRVSFPSCTVFSVVSTGVVFSTSGVGVGSAFLSPQAVSRDRDKTPVRARPIIFL